LTGASSRRSSFRESENAGWDYGCVTANAPLDDPLNLRAALAPSAGRPHPWCAGAVAYAGCGREELVHQAVGWAVRYAAYDDATDRGVELPPQRWVPASPDTVFDLASLTKLFIAVVAVQQLERGALALDGRVAEQLPLFAPGGKHVITVRQLLTHTSGLRAELPFHEHASPQARLRLLRDEEPVTAPGSAYHYSDLNFIALQLLLERVTGKPLDVLVRAGVTGPLGMRDTRYRPPGTWRERIAATEDQRRPRARLDRGMLRGTVHDENAHAFGGVAGHAGLFSTAADLAVLCRALLEGGGPILRPASVRLMLQDAGVPGHPHGLGFELNQPWFMGELAGPRAAGHTGFTGTSLVIDFDRGRFLVLLANAVHPTRTWPNGSGPRAWAATALTGEPRGRQENDFHLRWKSRSGTDPTGR
jgi:CubicO group peptidase (beta-lactamase class C family)